MPGVQRKQRHMIIWSKTKTDICPPAGVVLVSVPAVVGAGRKPYSPKCLNPGRKTFRKEKFYRLCATLSKDKILSELKAWAQVGKGTHIPYHVRRKKILGLRLRKACYACGNRAQLFHHVILIKNGGENKIGNMVELCKDCHSEIHIWLEPNTPKFIKEMDAAFSNTIGATAAQIKGGKV